MGKKICEIRTCAVLCHFDGTTKIGRYDVLVGPVNKRGAFNAHKARCVGSYYVKGTEFNCYAGLCAKHPEFPPVYWQQR
jgi:hypothetical protein